MRLRQEIVPSVLCGLLLVMTGARAAGSMSSDSPYQGIVDRNVFNLKPPPPPGSDEPPPPPPPKIVLSGITTILGAKQVLMKVAMPPKPPEPAKEKTLFLVEGESQDDITVLAIDTDAGTVKVKNHGIEETLDITKNGSKPPTAAAANPAAPGVPGVGIPGGFPPGLRPPTPLPPLPNPNGAAGLRTIPTRPLRAQPLPGGNSFMLPNQGGQNPH
jgi:hypothetical protein